MSFVLCLLIGVAFAGEPVVKGGKLSDDAGAALTVRNIAIPGGTAVSNVYTLSGQHILSMSLARSGTTTVLSASFPSLGLALGAQVPATDAPSQIVAFWNAGVLTREGADKAALLTWAKAQNVVVRDTAADAEKMAAYAASHPTSTGSGYGSGSSYGSSGGASASTAKPTTSSAPATPAVVSVSMHVSCAQNVRVFTGASANSGGTYGWESPNSTRSLSLKPGSVVCIADSHDKVQSCWTVPTSSARVDVGCGGFTAR